MGWLDDTIETLVRQPVCGYQRVGRPCVEPTALQAALALLQCRHEKAALALDWLANTQSDDGSLGIDGQTPDPGWPTGWAILAWNTAAKTLPHAKPQWSAAAGRATAWTLGVRGRTAEPEDARLIGHDTTLEGWPWVLGTHSWVEPTAISLLALRSADLADHPRSSDAVKMLVDRQLPSGGWNYGNTTVLGHVLRPHVQSTGLALAALAGLPKVQPKVMKSVKWLHQTINDRTTTASLCYALMGLVGYGDWPNAAAGWLESAYRRTMSHGGSPYQLALLVLAAKSHRKREK